MKAVLCLSLLIVCVTVAAGIAAAAPTVAITSPEEGLTIASRLVSVEAAFRAPEGTTVELVEFAVDGTTIEAQTIDPPAASGKVSFTWLAQDYTAGKHRLTLRAIGSEGKTAKTSITVELRGPLAKDGGAVRIISPATGEVVSGTVEITVEPDSPTLPRYVIFLVDDVLKAISNVRPFAYRWDTTRYLNGVHTLKAKIYATGESELVSDLIAVTVNNPSGATAMRTPSIQATPVAPAPVAPPVLAAEMPLPPAVHTDSPAVAVPTAALPAPEPALPGTAPYVSESGELITPPIPMQLAALPVAPVASVPPVTSASEVTPAPAGTADALAPQPNGERAQVEIAMLPTEATPPVPAAPAPVTLAPAEQTFELPAVAAVPATRLQAEGTTPPAVAPVAVAMLPPLPVQAIPAPKVTATPAPSHITYVVRSAAELTTLAAALGVPAEEIARASGLRPDTRVQPGQALNVPSIPMMFAGKPFALDTPAVLANGRAIVPFRAVVEQTGGTVTWDGVQRQASAVAASGHHIAVTIGSDQAAVDGKLVAMGAAAQVKCDRTVVPMRFLGDALDLALQYEDGVIHLAQAK